MSYAHTKLLTNQSACCVCHLSRSPINELAQLLAQMAQSQDQDVHPKTRPYALCRVSNDGTHGCAA